MRDIKLSDINLLDVGTNLFLAGTLWTGNGRAIIALFPDGDFGKNRDIEILRMDVNDWQNFLRQSDIQEVEILKHDNGNIVKAIARKTQRLIETHITWTVYKRDGYRCRYCGRDGIALTVDHIILWEEMGPSIEENLLATCRKCNNMRGNTPYEKWIVSPEYEQVSRNLDSLTKQKNLDIVNQLEYLRSLTRLNRQSR